MRHLSEAYTILETLGRGGTGEVRLAQRHIDGAYVVLKSLLPQYAQSQETIRRFYQEAAILAQLSHPAIVQLYDFFVVEGTPYLVMEYVAGQSLQAILEQTQAPLAWRWTYSMLTPILQALAYLHERGILHRDIKPSNILILPDGGAKLIDFGIAKGLDRDLSLTQTGAQVGTVLYLAPEQIRGEPATPQSDLYSMGLVLYECLFGRYPWQVEGKSLYQIYQTLLKAPLPVPSWAPPRWQRFFAKALAKDPKQRFPSAEAMLAAFAQLDEANTNAPPCGCLAGRGSYPYPLNQTPKTYTLAIRTGKLGATYYFSHNFLGRASKPGT